MAVIDSLPKPTKPRDPRPSPSRPPLAQVTTTTAPAPAVREVPAPARVTPVPSTQVSTRVAPAPRSHTAPIRASGDLEVAPGSRVRDSISTAAKITLGRGCELAADVHAGAEADVQENAHIRGHLEVEGTVRWSRGARAGRATIRGSLVTDDSAPRLRHLDASGGIRPLSARRDVAKEDAE